MKEGFDKPPEGKEDRREAGGGDATRMDADREYLLNESFMAIAVRRPRFEVGFVDGKIRVAAVDGEKGGPAGESNSAASNNQLVDAQGSLVTSDEEGREFLSDASEGVQEHAESTHQARGDLQYFNSKYSEGKFCIIVQIPSTL